MQDEEGPATGARLVGRDEYHYVVNPDYLLKGDRFRAERDEGYGDGKLVAYGTAAMSGNAVSPVYGWLAYEANGEDTAAQIKRAVYQDTFESYINVQLDHGTYDSYTRINESMHPIRDRWTFWVDASVRDRVQQAQRDEERMKKRKVIEQALVKAREKFSEAETAFNEAGDRVDEIESLIATLSRDLDTLDRVDEIRAGIRKS